MPKTFKLNVKIRTVANHLPELEKALRLLERNEVLVGVPAENADRQAKGPINNAALAYIHSAGSPTQNIPARPFLEPGIKDDQENIVAQMQKAADAALDAKPEQVLKSLNAAGIVATSAVKNKINSNIPPPLKPSTLAARRRRGRTGTRTLIDTGALRNSLTYVIREK